MHLSPARATIRGEGQNDHDGPASHGSVVFLQSLSASGSTLEDLGSTVRFGRIGGMEKRDLTELLNLAASGDDAAASSVWAMIYREVRVMARGAVRSTGRSDAEGRFEASAIVNEVYIRLQSGTRAERWDSRRHYFGSIARAMHRFLIDTVRSIETKRRGGGAEVLGLGAIESIVEDSTHATHEDATGASERALSLLLALESLEAVDGTAATVLRMRFVFELTNDEVAQALELEDGEVERLARFGRVWIRRELGGSGAT